MISKTKSNHFKHCEVFVVVTVSPERCREHSYTTSWVVMLMSFGPSTIFTLCFYETKSELKAQASIFVVSAHRSEVQRTLLLSRVTSRCLHKSEMSTSIRSRDERHHPPQVWGNPIPSADARVILLWEIFISQHLLSSPLPFLSACLAQAMQRSVHIFTTLN